MGEAADEECEYRAAVVHTSFGRDPYVQGAHAMLASSDPQQAKLLSMYTGQVQMVARGDDLRGASSKTWARATWLVWVSAAAELQCWYHVAQLLKAGQRSNRLPSTDILESCFVRS
jgi:hypothetical protein